MQSATEAALWFRQDTLDLADEHVFLMLTTGQQVVGCLRLTATAKRRFEIFEGGRRYAKIDLRSVSLWRPVDILKWPYALPDNAPLTKPFEWPVYPNDTAEVDAAEDGPGWPYPGLHLGRPGEPPQSTQELEARLLRAIRTARVQEYEAVKVDVSWHPELVVASKLVEKQLEASRTRKLAKFRPEDYDDFHIDRSDLSAKPARFNPTPRDVSDYECGIVRTWLAHAYPRDRWIFKARSEAPPVPWWAIADEERCQPGDLRRRYRDALMRMFNGVGSR